jgi:NUMOD3 motif/HNH endonuclease
MTHPLAGRKQSPEHVAKRVAAHIGKPLSPERKEKLRLSRLGRPLSEEHKGKISLAMKGKRNSLGTNRSEEYRRHLSDYWAAHKEDHNFFVDGRSAIRKSERVATMGTVEYRMWREAVFSRDNWTCVMCGARGDMHADHIKSYRDYPELRFSVENGRTLCPPCHRKTDNFGRKGIPASEETKRKVSLANKGRTKDKWRTNRPAAPDSNHAEQIGV